MKQPTPSPANFAGLALSYTETALRCRAIARAHEEATPEGTKTAEWHRVHADFYNALAEDAEKKAEGWTGITSQIPASAK